MNENILHYSLNLQNTPFMYVFLVPLVSRRSSQGLEIKQLTSTQIGNGESRNMNLCLPDQSLVF